MLKLAFDDLFNALKRWPLWVHLGWSEIRLRYRRSVLGPWWITLSMVIFASAMGVVYGKLFKQNMMDYMPFFICGMLVWSFIAACVNDSSNIFRNSAGFIKQIKLPYFIYLLKFVFTNVVILAHNLVAYVGIAVLCRIHPTWNIFLAVPGFLLVILNVTWVTLLIGMIGTRFRDIPQIITNVVQITFFISPITWMPKLVGEQSLILKLNPVSYILDIVRDPLLGNPPPLLSWIVSLGLFIVGSSFTFLLFAKFRSRISFWIE